MTTTIQFIEKEGKKKSNKLNTNEIGYNLE